MKVTKITLRDWYGNELNELKVVPLGDRYYRIADNIEVIVSCGSKEYRYNFCSGFVTNFRSGGKLVDSFIDQIGEKLSTQLCWLVHDGNYTPCKSLGEKHPMGRKDSDQLLRAMLRFSGLSSFQASCVYNSVRIFGGSAYNDDDHLTKTNSELFSFATNKEAA